MKLSFAQAKQSCGIVLEIALGVFLLAMLLTAWKTPESRAVSANSLSKASREALLPLQGTPCMVNCPADICLQDDYSSNILRINSQTGAYEFTNCQGVTLIGTGTISRQGDIVYLQQYGEDRIVNAGVGAYPNYGTATITSWALGRSFSITDSNTTNNTCACP